MAANTIYVSGILPFVLLMEDSITDDGRTINDKVIPIIPFNGELTAGLFLSKKVNENQPGIIVASEDLHGKLTYSEFLIVYKQEYTNGVSLDELFFKENIYNMDSITDYTVSLLNKFVEIYKTTLHPEKDWIPFLTKQKINPWKIDIYDETDSRISGIGLLSYSGTGVMIGSVVDINKENEIKKLCMTPELKLSPAARFIQEANRYLKTGDYTSAVLFIHFYLEKWIFREVQYKLKDLGFNESDIKKKIKGNNGRLIDFRKAVKLITGNLNFKNSSAYKDYEQNVINIRDEIVHRDRDVVSKETTEKAFDYTTKLRDYLQGIIWSN